MLNQKDSPGDCRRTMQHWICAAGRGGGLGFPVCWCVSSARCCRYQYFARSGDRITCCMSCYREGTIVFLHQRSSFKPQSHLLKNKRYHCLPSRIGESDQTNKSTCCNASRHVYGPNMIGRTPKWMGKLRNSNLDTAIVNVTTASFFRRVKTGFHSARVRCSFCAS